MQITVTWPADQNSFFENMGVYEKQEIDFVPNRGIEFLAQRASGKEISVIILSAWQEHNEIVAEIGKKE
jgi:hypothetical protein